MRGRSLAVLLGLSCWCGAVPAAAESRLWRRAAEPERARVERLEATAEELLARAGEAGGERSLRGAFVEHAVALLALDRARVTRTPRLRVMRGLLLASGGVERYAEARADLEAASALASDEADDDPETRADAAQARGIACAKERDEPCELGAWAELLELAWDPEVRGLAHLNRAETHLGAERLEAAIADYRRAAALAQGPAHQALALFGLGVALDRAGDLPGALRAVRTAAAIPVPPTGSALDAEGVFFVPAWDRHYYDALVAMAEATGEGAAGAGPRNGTDPVTLGPTDGTEPDAAREAAREAWQRAIDAWQLYLGGEERARGPRGAPRLGERRARANLARSRAALAALAEPAVPRRGARPLPRRTNP